MKSALTWEEGSGWSTPQLAAHGIARRPAIALVDSRPLIVFQVEGHKRVAPRAGDYLFQREGGGSGIGYAWLGEAGWQRGDVAAPEEILIQDRCEADVYQGRLYPMVEEMGPPALVCDHHGVAWAIWNNTTRRHTYFARWLGGVWSDPYECAGSFYAPTPCVAAEGSSPAGTRDLALAVVAADRLYYLGFPVPSLDPASSRHVLFLDLLELARVENLELQLNQFERFPGNPVLGPGPDGARDDAGVSFPNVRRFGDRFIMHYHMRGKHRSSDQEENRMGYAESEDGVHWTKPSIPPSDNPEILPCGPDNSVPWVSGNFIDEEEPDPNRRFKGVTLTGKWTQTRDRWLVTSPDGKYWRVEGPAEDMYCILEGGGPSFRDPDAPAESRFRAVGRSTSTAGRALGMMVSPDLLHWYGKESLLDVDDPYGRPAMLRRGGFVSQRILDPIGEKGAHQIYWGVVWKEHGLYLCLYAPYRYDGRYDVALAVSRDGFHFMRVRNGERILPCGESGHWDRGSIAVGYGFGKPLRLEDRLRLYYSASTGHHGTRPWGSLSSIGFADLPFDGYTSLRVRRDGPNTTGAFVTVPFEVPQGFRPAVGVRVGPEYFYKPGDGDGPRGLIVAEILDAGTQRPIPPFDADHCRGCTTPGTHVLEWPGADAGQLVGRKVRLRFLIKGLELSMYSFWFAKGGDA